MITTTHQVTTTDTTTYPCGCVYEPDREANTGTWVTVCDTHANADEAPEYEDPVTCACGCETPVTPDTGSDWCGRVADTILPDHHGHWGDCS